jgi:hypothetical protein
MIYFLVSVNFLCMLWMLSLGNYGTACLSAYVCGWLIGSA